MALHPDPREAASEVAHDVITGVIGTYEGGHYTRAALLDLARETLAADDSPR